MKTLDLLMARDQGCLIPVMILMLTAFNKGVLADNCTDVCGYGTSCRSFLCGSTCFKCACDSGFNTTATLPASKPPVIYCFKECSKKGECPENTTCDLEHNKTRCECAEGFVRSDLGACVEKGCNGECGHGMRCDRGKCHCLHNYAGKKTLTHSKGTVYYCTHICKEDGTVCPPNATCTEENIYNTTKYRCQCSPGFSLSYPGQCLADDTTTTVTRNTSTVSEQAPASQSPTIGLALGIGGGVLLIIIVIAVVVIMRRRRLKNDATTAIHNTRQNDTQDNVNVSTTTGDSSYENVDRVLSRLNGTDSQTFPAVVRQTQAPGSRQQALSSPGGMSHTEYERVHRAVQPGLRCDENGPYTVLWAQ